MNPKIICLKRAPPMIQRREGLSTWSPQDVARPLFLLSSTTGCGAWADGYWCPTELSLELFWTMRSQMGYSESCGLKEEFFKPWASHKICLVFKIHLVVGDCKRLATEQMLRLKTLKRPDGVITDLSS